MAAEQDEAFALQQEGRLMVQRTDSLWFAMSALIDSAEAVGEAALDQKIVELLDVFGWYTLA